MKKHYLFLSPLITSHAQELRSTWADGVDSKNPLNFHDPNQWPGRLKATFQFTDSLLRQENPDPMAVQRENTSF